MSVLYIFTGECCIRFYGSCEDARREKKSESFLHKRCATGEQVFAAKVGNERHRAARRKRYAKKMLKKFGEFPPSDECKQTVIDFDDFDNFIPF